jgi:hypothetical protein
MDDNKSTVPLFVIAAGLIVSLLFTRTLYFELQVSSLLVFFCFRPQEEQKEAAHIVRRRASKSKIKHEE